MTPTVSPSTAPDSLLAEQFQSGDEHALAVLLQRYRRFARARSRRYFIVGGDADDLEQEALIGLFKAARDFRRAHGVAFRAFAEVCITRQILTAIKSANRRKHQPLNRSVSMNAVSTSVAGGRNDGAGRTLEETLPRPGADDPLEQLVGDERVDVLRGAIERRLSDLEAEVLGLYVGGMAYADIGDHVGRHAKSVDNAVQRIKHKLDGELRAHEQLAGV